jgi:hypothetical protein
MPHTVIFKVPTRELGKSDVHFLVKKSGKVFGKLEASKGAIVWYPKSTTFGHKISWSKLDRFALEQERYERRKRR